MYTYGSLINTGGQHEAIPRVVRYGYAREAQASGLLDWEYRPLDELRMKDNDEGRKEIRINTALKYDLTEDWKLEGLHQYQLIMSNNRVLYQEESFFARNLVNRYTQSDLSRPLPLGGVLDRSQGDFYSHYGRLQTTYARKWSKYHDLNFLGGMEIRQEENIDEGGKRLYGYIDNILTAASNVDFNRSYTTRPNSSATIPYFTSPGTQIIDRFVSYYGNFGYSFQDRYMLSGSLRWDGSNIFGVDFNQKGIPLWSTGIAWNMHKEKFLDRSWIDVLKLRATFGANGNILRSHSSLPYIVYGHSNVVSRSLIPARLGSVGNPSLSWERVNTFNLGVDFSAFSSRIGGALEWYDKQSSNLIGKDYLDPTTGIIPILTYFNIANDRNYADMRTSGFDVDLNSINTDGPWKWRTYLMVSFTSNEVTNYYATDNLPITSYLTYGTPTVRQGVSKDQLYAIPWHGLNKEGDPQVLNSGTLNTDYTTYFNGLNYEDLLPIGVSVAPYFGAVRNSLDWQNLSFSLNITWRTGHKFRRESVLYDSFFRTGINGHEDYLQRWMKPGDELWTNVPSMPEGTNSGRNQAYIFSEALIEDASTIRLKDIQLSYTVYAKRFSDYGIKSLRLSGYAQNLGIVWKASKSRLDPDARAFYPQPFQVNFGVQANF